MKTRAAALLLSSFLLVAPALAQDADLPAGASTTPAETERIARVEEALESDRTRLETLRERLVDSQDFYERENALLKLRRADLAELETPELEAQVTRLTERVELGYQALKTRQQQIVALEQKLQADEQALLKMTGMAPEDPPQPSAAATPPPPEAASAPVAPTGADEAAAPLPETPEQIEARLEAERRELQASEDAAAVADFVERKAALEKQIELEESLLLTANEADDLLGAELLKLEKELAAEISEGADRETLRATQARVAATVEELRAIDRQTDESQARLRELNKRLHATRADQIRVVEEAEQSRRDAEVARQRSVWLESPLHPTNLLRWAVTRGPRILAVLAAVGLLLVLVRVSSRRVTRVMVGESRGTGAARANRAETLALSFRSAASGLILVVGILLALQEAGLDVTTVLGGAAIFGLAVAFGAQNLMRDYFNGLMIMIEDQYGLNDLLTIGGITGTVESVHMRTTVLRDIEGRLHFIPNGEIKAVTNRTYSWSRAVFDIRVAYKEDVDRVMSTLIEVAQELRTDPDFRSWILEDPVMLGVDGLTESGVVIKFMLKTQPDRAFPVRREMLRRIKNRFDELGIEIPVPHRVVIHREEHDAGRAEAPAAIHPRGGAS